VRISVRKGRSYMLLWTMKKNIDRQKHFSTFRSPTPDENDYEAVMAFHKKQLESDPKLQKEFKEKYEKASTIGYTQSRNGIGFIQDKELRFFHAEFNWRASQYGFGSMPASFNILEGFFRWSPDLFYFELFDEEEHMFSLFDFFDFVTSKDCSGSIDYFIENVQDELIYSYNILNDVMDITFSTSDSKVYVIGGVSFVKRGNEVFMLLVAGELGDTKEITKDLPDYNSGTKTKSYLKPRAKRKKEAVGLFGREDLWKVNVYLRIDLDRKTIDSRYIQKDTGVGFTTITDDYGMLKLAIEDKEVLENVIESQSEEIATYESIFEAAYNCLFLPEYFDFYDESVLPEEHPTDLSNETLRGRIFKNQPKFNSSYFIKNRDVWVLDRHIDPVSGGFVLKKTELKIEKDGYWERLEPGKIGIDKNGKEIHSRTWVEKTLSWHESKVAEPDVEITIPKTASQNKGYIYLLRNATHELDLFKIGLTTNTVEERAKQLSGTSSPDRFLIISRWAVQDCVLAEKLIHKKLGCYRLSSKREFFKIKLEVAIKEIIPIIDKINNNEI
jgi:hypothetical protein